MPWNSLGVVPRVPASDGATPSILELVHFQVLGKKKRGGRDTRHTYTKHFLLLPTKRGPPLPWTPTSLCVIPEGGLSALYVPVGKHALAQPPVRGLPSRLAPRRGTSGRGSPCIPTGPVPIAWLPSPSAMAPDVPLFPFLPPLLGWSGLLPFLLPAAPPCTWAPGRGHPPPPQPHPGEQGTG